MVAGERAVVARVDAGLELLVRHESLLKERGNMRLGSERCSVDSGGMTSGSTRVLETEGQPQAELPASRRNAEHKGMR